MFIKVKAQLEVWLRGREPKITETVGDGGVTIAKTIFSSGEVLYWSYVC